MMAQRIRFHVDEHVSRAVITGLRQRGIEVTTVLEAGLFGASDEAHLERAHNEGWVIYTNDADFLRLHASGMDHGGIVFAKQASAVGEVIRGLVLIHQLLTAEDLKGKVEFI